MKTSVFARTVCLARAVCVGIVTTLLLTGCSLFGGGEQGNLFTLKPGDCFLAPEKVKAQISSLEEVDCESPHDQEAFGVLVYAGSGAEESTIPSNDVLTNWAEGACAKEFGSYVGVDYLDSSLFYTYLMPSARSWQEKDRSVVCFAIDSGRPLTGSVKGSKR